MKRVMFLMGGVLWLCFALGFGAFLVRYIGGGAGLQSFGGAGFVRQCVAGTRASNWVRHGDVDLLCDWNRVVCAGCRWRKRREQSERRWFTARAGFIIL
jgi:hypothetical protein